MENLPSSLYSSPTFTKASPSSPSMSGGSGGGTTVVQVAKDQKMTLVEQLVLDLCNPERREKALLVLSKALVIHCNYYEGTEVSALHLSWVVTNFQKREMFQDLAPLLWHSFGTITALLQEIITVYPAISPPALSSSASNRVCNALALLQCVASHSETRTLFLNAKIPLYLYPFLKTNIKTRPFEYLRLTSLGVIGALVKVDDTEVINSLLQTELIPLCFHTMKIGSELSKTVATFIIQKILLDDVGLRYMCATADRFFDIGSALASMVISLVEQPSTRLLKHIIRCYLRLSDNPRACAALQTVLPDMLKDGTFNNCLREDPSIQHLLQQLLVNVAGGAMGGATHPGLHTTGMGI